MLILSPPQSDSDYSRMVARKESPYGLLDVSGLRHGLHGRTPQQLEALIETYAPR